MLVTVIGGSGFVGRHIVKELAKRGHRVRVACRRPDLAGHVTPSGVIGQIALVQANLRYPSSIEAAVSGADVVVNCVGILAETGRQSFQAVQAKGAETIAAACSKAGARLVHLSAIGADEASLSLYARSKALGEKAVLAIGGVVIRPSLVFGSEDKLFNRFAAMAKMSPVLPIVGGKTLFQPIYVGDLAEICADCVDGTYASKVLEVGGSEIYSLKAMIEKMLTVIGRKRLIIDLPLPVASLMASVLQFAPGKPLTPDQVLLLGKDNIVNSEGILGKTTLDEVLASYLWQYRVEGQFNKLAVK